MSKTKTNTGNDAVVAGAAAEQPKQAIASSALVGATGYEGRGGLYQDNGNGALVLQHRTAAATENTGDQSI